MYSNNYFQISSINLLSLIHDFTLWTLFIKCVMRNIWKYKHFDSFFISCQVNSLFSIAESKAQVSFSYRNKSVVCRRHCCCRLHQFQQTWHKTFLSKWNSILTNEMSSPFQRKKIADFFFRYDALGTKHFLVKRAYVSAYKGPFIKREIFFLINLLV